MVKPTYTKNQYDPSPVRGPSPSDRVMIIGKTGSGKSQFMSHVLSTRDYDLRPWVIIDYKGDDILLELKRLHKDKIKSIHPSDEPPKKPGLYYMQPTPKVDDDDTEAWLWKVWKQARDKGIGVGLVVDEGYQLPQRDGFDVILTQGRSLNIPVICLYQRPAWMSRFAVAQASFIAIFDQNDERDCKTTKEFIRPAILPDGSQVTVFDDLPPYYCLWYDVSKGRTSILSPAPSRQEILAKFAERLSSPKAARETVAEGMYLYG